MFWHSNTDKTSFFGAWLTYRLRFSPTRPRFSSEEGILDTEKADVTSLLGLWFNRQDLAFRVGAGKTSFLPGSTVLSELPVLYLSQW